MEVAVIKIPKGITGMDTKTNGVPIGQIVTALDILLKHFSRQMVSEAKESLGPNHSEKELDDYLQTMLDVDRADIKRFIENGGNQI